MKKKYQVFISSTYEDLKDERMAVVHCLLACNCIPVGMEYFPSIGMSQMEYIEMMLDDCDYYILILAGRYGSIDIDGISYTEKEFDYAISKDIPIMAFLFEDTDSLPSNKCEQDNKGRIRLKKFREKVKKNGQLNFYTDIGDLKTKVAISIHQCITSAPAVGWVRGNDASPPVNFKENISHFLKENTMTKEDIEAILNEHTATDEEVTEMLDEVFGKDTER